MDCCEDDDVDIGESSYAGAYPVEPVRASNSTDVRKIMKLAKEIDRDGLHTAFLYLLSKVCDADDLATVYRLLRFSSCSTSRSNGRRGGIGYPDALCTDPGLSPLGPKPTAWPGCALRCGW
jgi:hypothetical protein